MGIQITQAQYAEDALRYSQLGLGVGARELGMGNATVGGVNDYSALFWNPAGLALERDFEFSFGLSRLGYTNDVSYLGTKMSSNNSAVNLNNLGLVYPIPTVQGSLTFAFGFNRAENYTTTASMNAFNPSSSIVLSDSYLNTGIPYTIWLTDSNGVPRVTGNIQQLVSVLEGGGLNHWTAGGAIDIGKDLSAGVSLNYASGSYSYNQKFNESDTRNFYLSRNFQFDYLTDEITTGSDVSGFNALLGLMVRKSGRYGFGITVRTPTTYDISKVVTEDASSQVMPDSVQGLNVYNTNGSYKTNYKVTTPFVFSAGISVQPFAWLMLAIDAEYTDWTQMEISTDDPNDATIVNDANSLIKNSLQATTNLRGGAELTIANIGLILRGGFIFNQSPYKGVPSSWNQLYYTSGIGLLLDEHTTLNAAYAYGSWKTLSTNYSYTVSGITYDVGTDETVTTNNLNLTLSYRF